MKTMHWPALVISSSETAESGNGRQVSHWFLTVLIIDEVRSSGGKRSFPCEWLTHQITKTPTNQIIENQTKIVLHWYKNLETNDIIHPFSVFKTGDLSH